MKSEYRVEILRGGEWHPLSTVFYSQEDAEDIARIAHHDWDNVRVQSRPVGEWQVASGLSRG